MRKSITILFGTRPEAIKLAPVILKLKEQNVSHRVIHTGQHAELANEILSYFDIVPDVHLQMMKKSQSPLDLLQRLLEKLPEEIHPGSTNVVLVQGDTTSALAGSLTAHFQKISVAHLEAGLRSRDRDQPFPEETNRTLISHMSDINFAPTEGARQNLLAENIPDNSIYVTGNSVVDALHLILQRSSFTPQTIRKKYGVNSGRLILLTTHRRENFGAPIQHIFRAIVKIARQIENVTILFPIHPNPNIKEQTHQLKRQINIKLIDPLSYENFVPLMAAADLILTDSGGIQEEAPALGTPVFVLRNKTERPELLESGAGKMIGTDTSAIVNAVSHFFNSEGQSKKINVFGDGQTASRVVSNLLKYSGNSPSIH